MQKTNYFEMPIHEREFRARSMASMLAGTLQGTAKWYRNNGDYAQALILLESLVYAMKDNLWSDNCEKWLTEVNKQISEIKDEMNKINEANETLDEINKY
jgi:hypothetical protein